MFRSFLFMEEHAMKNLTLKTLAAGLGASALLMIAAPPAIAGQWDGEPDLEMSILNDDLSRPAYVGTGMSDRARVYIYPSRDSAFPNQDVDLTGFATGTAGPEKGDGDLYGSILFDVGAWR
jgi:hypothetical protein